MTTKPPAKKNSVILMFAIAPDAPADAVPELVGIYTSGVEFGKVLLTHQSFFREVWAGSYPINYVNPMALKFSPETCKRM